MLRFLCFNEHIADREEANEYAGERHHGILPVQSIKQDLEDYREENPAHGCSQRHEPNGKGVMFLKPMIDNAKSHHGWNS